MKKITYFTSQQIASGVYRNTDISMTKMYLVICTEKAAVLDAGIGYGNLHEYVRTITDKPLIVLISHGHLDHAMGTGAFPGDVYMNHNDIKICIAHQDVEKR